TGNSQGFGGIQGRYLLPLLPFASVVFTVPLREKWYTYASVVQLSGCMTLIFLFYLGVMEVM
ncbi:MAG: hypothetical protein K2Q01_04660, partial [Rickettsiales bacterium]|nr:hypothetical protein [Rickettsiales bacterium]